MTLVEYIQKHSSFTHRSIESTVQLLDDGATIPFIARYRKERTGSLDEVAIGAIKEAMERYHRITLRKKTILEAMEEQGVLTSSLREKLAKLYDLTLIEDFYLPYKKKRRTKAEVARQQGLEPLAKIIMAQGSRDVRAAARSFVKGEVSSAEEAIQGAQYIIAEWINERTDIRGQLRKQLSRYAEITTKVKSKHKDSSEAQTYKSYFEWSERLDRCPSHRLLAILRAEKEGFISVKLEIDNDAALHAIERRLLKNESPCKAYIQEAIKDSYKRLLLPSLANERLNSAKERSDETAIGIFGENLDQLLMAAPLGEKRILAIDPGYRTGCKVVCLDENGSLLMNDKIYVHESSRLDHAKASLEHWISKYKIDAIAIGDGTASRETEHVVRSTSPSDVEIYVVSEAGASIYSASEIGRAEFPDHDITVRGAVSIGRRLADPLAELVKLDPKSIGVGQYQHDVDQGLLKKSLDTVVESCVNRIGVNLNTASESLLSYVSGIGPALAKKIVQYRKQEGGFTSRSELKKVPRFGAKAFEQSAAFLRIRDGRQPLDATAIHPERYDLVRRIAKDTGVQIRDIIGEAKVVEKIDFKKFVNSEVGLPTLKDIKNELSRPGVDIRASAKPFAFDARLQVLEDVREGMIVSGIVNNITAFGCFVNIGIKESGLVHISHISNKFVEDIHKHVRLNQEVTVKVLGVELDRRRVQLSMVLEG